MTPFVRNRLVFVTVVTVAIGALSFAAFRDARYSAIAMGVSVGFWSSVALMHWMSVRRPPWAGLLVAALLVGSGVLWCVGQPPDFRSPLVWLVVLLWAGIVGYMIWTAVKRLRAPRAPSL